MPTTLVLLPGLDGSGEQFAPLLDAVGSSFEVSVARYPNSGAVDFEAHEAAARAAISGSGPFVLLGESFSGSIAIRLAATAPPGLVGLILCASFARFPRPALRFLRPFTALISPAAMPVWLVASLVLGGSATPMRKRLLSGSLRGICPAALRARAASVFDIDSREELSRVAVPVLYLRGTRDRLVPASAGCEVMRLAHQAVMTDIQAPHFVLQSESVVAAKVIRQFVDACG